MVAPPATPPPAAWDRALDGIRELGRELKAQGDVLRSLQEQITDVRSAYTRAAPMTLMTQLEGRVATLESGATAAILRRLDEDREARAEQRREDRDDREARRKELDAREAQERERRAAERLAQARRDRLFVGLLAGLIVVGLLLFGGLIWLGVR